MCVLCVQILEGMPMTDEVEQLLRVLGPFYELVDEKKKISQISDISTGRIPHQTKLLPSPLCMMSNNLFVSFASCHVHAQPV